MKGLDSCWIRAVVAAGAVLTGVVGVALGQQGNVGESGAPGLGRNPATAPWVSRSGVKAWSKGLPVFFIRNEGERQAGFFQEDPGRRALFTEEGVQLVLWQREPREARGGLPESHAIPEGEVMADAVWLAAVGGHRVPPVGEDPLPGKVHYLVGRQPESWRVDVPTYGKVRYPELFPGVDVVFYGGEAGLEYDLVVAPGARPEAAAFEVEGAARVWVDADGSLLVALPSGRLLRQHKPYAYQEVHGSRREVPVRYVVAEAGGSYRFSFQLGPYDPTRALVIDPVVLNYATLLGGSGHDYARDLAVDAAGDVYVVGYSYSPDFPTRNPYAPLRGGGDVIVAKLNGKDGSLVYATYLGGANSSEDGNQIAVDSAGHVYVTGVARSLDFPIRNGFQEELHGEDAFVAKLSPTGNALLYSTLLGGKGSDSGNAIAVDSQGKIYVAGETEARDFPVKNPFQPVAKDWDAFVAKIDPDQKGKASLIYATYLGGSGADAGLDIAVDSRGNAYVTGYTRSEAFPVTGNAFDTSFNGYEDAFVAVLDPPGKSLVFSTFLGGNATDTGWGVAVDAQGNVVVAGETSSPNFPTEKPYQKAQGDRDVFVAKLASGGKSLLFATYLGGRAADYGHSVALDRGGRVYVVGLTRSSDFPAQNALMKAQGGADAFVAALDAQQSKLVFSTFLGGKGDDEAWGVGFDAAGNVFVAGRTESPAFPTTPTAFQKAPKGGSEVFMAKMSFSEGAKR